MALTLNGSTGLSGIVGSAGTPALQGSDTNTGYFFGTDILGLSTGGSERLRINSNGQTLINTNSALDGAVMLSVKNPIATDTVLDVVCGSTSHGSHVAFSDDAYARGIISYNHANDFLAFRTNGVTTDRLHITSAGEVLIGRTSKANDINKLVVTGTSPADSYDSTLYLEGSETTGAADTGGALAFGGHDNTAFRNWANIYGMKENGIGGNTASYLSFHTRAAGGNPAEKLRITSGGALQFSDTNSPNDKNTDIWVADDVLNFNAFGTNGAFLFKSGSSSTPRISIDSDGVKFGSDTAAENALNDYEEGTWTPTNTIGLTLTVNNTAYYVKVGKLCTVWFDISFTGFADSAQCSAIQSLPFTASDASNYYQQGDTVWYSNTNDAKKDHDDDNTLFFVDNDSTTLKIWNVTSGHLRVRSWAVVDANNGRRCRGTLTYRTKT